MSEVADLLVKTLLERDLRALSLMFGSIVAALAVQRRQCLANETETKTHLQKKSPAVTKLKLLSHENSGMMMMAPAVTTLTSYTSASLPEQYIKEKLKQLLRMNPWLRARLHSNATDGVHAVYPASFEGDDAMEQVVQDHLQVLLDFDLPENCSYDGFNQALLSLHVKNGNNCVNKPEEVLFRVSLLKVKGRDEVALVVSLSHVLGDGHTYYRILSMLDSATPVTALNPIRSDGYGTEMSRIVDSNAAKWLASPFPLLGMMNSAYLQKQSEFLLIRVDNEWINKQKLAHAESQKQHQNGGGASFISSNDILTAWHNRLCRSECSMMVLNARNRVPAFTDQTAGNYQTMIIYNTPEDCHTPEAIRESLRTYCSQSGTYPGVLKTLRWNASVSSNWCSFCTQVNIGGPVGAGASASASASDSHCSYLRHLPVRDPGELLCWGEVAVFFKIDAGTTGILLLTRHVTAQQIEATGVGRCMPRPLKD